MPTANAHCERPIGSIRRECLDYLIPLNAPHLRRSLREWACHHNAGRPHRSLGPGIPDRVQEAPAIFKASCSTILDFTCDRQTDPRRLASRVWVGRGSVSLSTTLLRTTAANRAATVNRLPARRATG
ncbi:MAG: transposase [Acidobacteriaceae bacterium]|nr:transposase [Acidobacteriaceae bacterium]